MDLLQLRPKIQALVTRCGGDFCLTFGFTNLRVLGKGMSGCVTLSMPPDGSEPQALKVFPKDSRQSRRRIKTCFEREVSILAKIRHKNIVEMIMAFDCPKMYIISMPYYPRGDLESLLPDISEEHTEIIFLQLTSAVRCLHSNRIAHRDIKPANVLITSRGDAVLTDFGLAISVTSERMVFTTFHGTTPYVAPEVRKGRKNDVIDCYKVDTYSLGMVLWCMMVRRKPFVDETDYLGVLSEQESNPGSFHYIVKRLLNDIVPERWNMEQLVSELRDTWSPKGHDFSSYFDDISQASDSSDSDSSGANSHVHSDSPGVSSLANSDSSRESIGDSDWSEEDFESNSGSEHSDTQDQDPAPIPYASPIGVMIQTPVIPAYPWPVFIPQTFVTAHPLVAAQPFVIPYPLAMFPYPPVMVPARYPAADL